MSRLLLSCLILLPALALADDPPGDMNVPVDAELRQHDVVYVEGSAPLRGEITSGRERGSVTLKITLVNGIKTEVDRGKVTKILAKETPKSGYQHRVKLIPKRESEWVPRLHRRLAEWCVKQGLREEAEAELRKAAKTSAGPEVALPHRERLAELLEGRAAELEGADRDTLLEAILLQVRAAKVFSARLALAEARVCLQLGLTELALPLLEKARDALDKKAKSKEPPPPPEKKEDGSGDEKKKDDAKQKDDDGGQKDPPRRFGRDGEPLPPPKKKAEDDGGQDGPAAPAPDDHGDQKLPGLESAERTVWKDVLATLARVATQLGKDEVTLASYKRVLEVWPQDKTASLGMARVETRRGKHQEVVNQLTEALRVQPKDSDLLRTRGQVHYLKGGADLEAQRDLKAAIGAAKDDGSTTARSARVAMALVHLVAGRFKHAQAELEKADADPGYGPARLARGLLSELSGDVSGAKVHYDEAVALYGSEKAAEVRYQRAFADRRGTKPDLKGAQKALTAALRSGYDFGLVMRAQIDLARARLDAKEEAKLVELMFRASKAPSADLLASLGRVYLLQKRTAEANTLFTRGLKKAPNHLPCLRGLAYCAYSDNQRDKARGLFKQILASAPDDAWAKGGLRNLEEARTRRVWTDAFDRTSLGNMWKVSSPFGVKVNVQGNRLRFAGKQTNQDDGKTTVYHEVSGETVVKLEVRLSMSDVNAGRAGIRVEYRSRHVVLFRDPADNKLYVSNSRDGGKLWADPRPIGRWPGGGNHTLAIDIEDPSTGKVAFIVDGRRASTTLTIGGIRRTRRCRLVIYGQARKLDERVEFGVDQARVYILREPESGPRKKGF